MGSQSLVLEVRMAHYWMMLAELATKPFDISKSNNAFGLFRIYLIAAIVVPTVTEEPYCPYDETMADTSNEPSEIFEVDSPNTPYDADFLFEPSPTPTEYVIKDVIRISPKFSPKSFRALVIRFRVKPTIPTTVIVTLVRKNSVTKKVKIDNECIKSNDSPRSL